MSDPRDMWCWNTSPQDAPHVALLCTMNPNHDGDHMATSSRRVLAAWNDEHGSTFVHESIRRPLVGP